jgi:hypothetical protein
LAHINLTTGYRGRVQHSAGPLGFFVGVTEPESDVRKAAAAADGGSRRSVGLEKVAACSGVSPLGDRDTNTYFFYIDTIFKITSFYNEPKKKIENIKQTSLRRTLKPFPQQKIFFGKSLNLLY